MTASIPPPDPRSADFLRIHNLTLKDGTSNGNGDAGHHHSIHDTSIRDSSVSWVEPELSLLEDRRGDLPQFPADGLGPAAVPFLQRAAMGAGTSVAHVAVPLLAIASSLIGAARQVRASTSWYEPLSLWTAIVGESGAGKTPGLDVTRRALGAIEKLRKESTEELRREHEQRAAVAKAKTKKWKVEVDQALEEGKPPPARPLDAEDLGPFVAPRLHVSNATTEKIAVLVKARPRGLLLISDELSGLFANLSRYSGGSDRPFWLECFNGGQYIVERLNRPSVTVDYLLVGLTGGFQPDKLDRAFAGDDDGMYARILYSWPEEPAYRPLTNEASFIDPQLQEALSRLIKLPAGEGTHLEPKLLDLSPEARTVFEEFREYQHERRARLEGRERQWCAKGPTHVLRLAGTLAHLDWSMRGGGDPGYAFKDDPQFQALLRNAEEPSEIDGACMRRAVDLWHDYFWPHAQACLRQMGLSEQNRLERRVLRWLKIEKRAEVSREEVRRDALARKFEAERVQAILDRLVVAGWLRERERATGGRPARWWEVNPLLFK
jgi:hypothetical protein